MGPSIGDASRGPAEVLELGPPPRPGRSRRLLAAVRQWLGRVAAPVRGWAARRPWLIRLVQRLAGRALPRRLRRISFGAVRRVRRNPLRPAVIGLMLLAVAGIVWFRPGPAQPARVPGSGTAARAHPAADGGSDLLQEVLQLARMPEPLRDYVRPDRSGGDCPGGPIGYSPAAVVNRVLAKVLPGFTVRDTARTFNQTPGLCAVTARAANRVGTVAVLEVSAPSKPMAGGQVLLMTSATESDGTTTTTAVQATTSTGWTIRFGSTGPTGSQPSIQQLFEFALDPALTW